MAEHDVAGPGDVPETIAFTPGRPVCPEGTTAIRFSEEGVDGLEDAPLALNSSRGGVTLTALDIEAGTMSFEVAPPNVAVQVLKGGQAGQGLYDYSGRPAGGVPHDDGLVTRTNPSGEPAAISHIDFCVRPAIALPKLQIAKTDSDADNPVIPGDDVTYTITATTTGAGGATGVVISDNLDDDLTVLSANFSNDGGPATACAQAAGNVIPATSEAWPLARPRWRPSPWTCSPVPAAPSPTRRRSTPARPTPLRAIPSP